MSKVKTTSSKNVDAHVMPGSYLLEGCSINRRTKSGSFWTSVLCDGNSMAYCTIRTSHNKKSQEWYCWVGSVMDWENISARVPWQCTITDGSTNSTLHKRILWGHFKPSIHKTQLDHSGQWPKIVNYKYILIEKNKALPQWHLRLFCACQPTGIADVNQFCMDDGWNVCPVAVTDWSIIRNIQLQCLFPGKT